jgi:ribonuclease VapC
MVIDSSALVAVVLAEPDAARYATAMAGNQPADRLVAAPNLTEAMIVVESRQGPDASRDLQLLVAGVGIEVTPVDEQLALAAVAAWRRFGKGRHPAGLNFGDCFAYALAKQCDLPLLFKGEDFTQTDVAKLE